MNSSLTKRCPHSMRPAGLVRRAQSFGEAFGHGSVLSDGRGDRERYGSSPLQPAARNGSSGTISRVAMMGRGEVPTRNSPMMLSGM